VIGTDERPVFDDGTPWEEAQAVLADRGIGDGLPLVPPTWPRIERMLAATRASRRSYGQLAPLFGELTPEAIAYVCVLAGCVPEELPVVATALTACQQPEFNLLGIQTTTGTPTVAVMVHGPIAVKLGMNAGANCLGPGNRANACIGRAVQLGLVHIGGAQPGIADMATMGQPGKYSFCFAEGEHALLTPLHVRRGFDADESAVTVLGVSGTAEVLPQEGRDAPELVLRPVLAAMRGSIEASASGRERPGGEQFFLLPPELADLLVKHGWDLLRMQDFLFQASNRPPPASAPADINPIIAGGAGIKMTYLPLWMGGTTSVTSAIID
jgi:hypothetical protein